MVKYNKIDDGAKEAVLRVLKKKRGGSNTKESGNKELKKEEPEILQEAEENIETSQAKEELVEELIKIDIDADTFNGTVDDYIDSRLEILQRPQYNEEGDIDLEGGSIPKNTLEKYMYNNGIDSEKKAVKMIKENIEIKKDLFRQKYGRELNMIYLLKTYEFNKLRTLSKVGAEQRAEMSKYILNKRPTDLFKNEVGYCNEYMFEKYVLNNPDTKMSIMRFLSSDVFYSSEDFKKNGKYYELKSVIQIDERDNRAHLNPIFWCPEDKANEILKKTNSFRIFWSVIKKNGTFKESCERYNDMVYKSVKTNNPDEYIKSLYYLDIDNSILSKIKPEMRTIIFNDVETKQSTYMFDRVKLGDKGIRHYTTNELWKPLTLADTVEFIDIP